MIKNILKNQKGVSLVEVTVASALSVMVAVGVMRINENANNSIKSIQNRDDILTLQNTLKVRLSQTEMCANATFNGGTNIVGHNLASAIGSLGTFSTGYTGAGNEFTVGQAIPGVPGWEMTSASMEAFNNGGTGSSVGTCDINLVVTKMSSKGYGGNEKKIRIPMTCEVDDPVAVVKNVIKCSSRVSVEDIDGRWQVATSGTGDFISFSGISGDAKARVGGNQITDTNVAAALTIDPQGATLSPAGLGNFYGIQLPDRTSLAFGTSGDIEVYYNPAADTGAGSTLTIDSSLRFSSASNPVLKDLDKLETRLIHVTNIDTFAGSDELTIGDTNDDISIGYNLWVNNEVRANTILLTSDKKFKKEITEIQNSVANLKKVRGVNYFMRSDEYPERNFNKNLQFGVIAQEVQKVYPNLVDQDESSDYLRVNYTGLIAVLIQANNEQQAELDKNKEMFLVMQAGIQKKNREQDQEISNLKDQNKLLQKRVDNLESALHKRIDELESKSDKINKLENKIDSIMELIGSLKAKD